MGSFKMIVVTYIGATWCKICTKVKPAVEELAQLFSVQLQIQDLDDLSEEEKEDVMKVPTVRIHKDGVQVALYSTNQAESLETWLRTHVPLTTDAEF